MKHKSTILVLFAFLLTTIAAAGCGSRKTDEPSPPAGSRGSGMFGFLEGEPESIRQWRTAEKLFDDEYYLQAAVAYRSWLADYRDEYSDGEGDVLRPFVLYRLGRCYQKVKDYDKAVQTYTLLVQKYSDSRNSHVRDLVYQTKLQLDDIRPRPVAVTAPAGAK